MTSVSYGLIWGSYQISEASVSLILYYHCLADKHNFSSLTMIFIPKLLHSQNNQSYYCDSCCRF
ncbi:hypothetical protein BRYFOR_05329 [Marvinbryantia formatexigens DSM 14469]|uniref:Uncharacterized protein n=1 Tax=Marvinbryantia formatexigens DSM 14469 TaxID=478749 RepID=C6L9N9_9FIRM|nr:hypothetical protein BRYFOR_05329 [Marvinbryantia formatexigens DSM 14469]